MLDEEARRIAVVTGGSRGIGASTAVVLAARGYDVALTYRNKAARAAGVVAQIESLGRRGLAVGGDMTDPLARDTLVGEVARWAGAADALVLNASGGLERDLLARDAAYPTRINREAQVELVRLMRPLLRSGGTIVFVTSHWAHCYGAVEQLASYEPIAASKHAGEKALRALAGDLGQDGVRLLVVSGDLIEGTITAKLLERGAPGLAARRAASEGAATVHDMSEAIASAIGDATLPSGATVVVGGSLASLDPIADRG